ncbi:hypothetical protein BD769DRAFT_1389932 [Suillus cothurnatus]|nr:hypothetical protein BD769DRAFT_1389932 [Suillus cothurnatus]
MSNFNSLVSPMPTPLTSAPVQTTLPPPPPPPLMTLKTYYTLYTASSIVHVYNITVPVLISIGEDYLRIGFYHVIKGVETWNATGDETGNETGTEKKKKKGIMDMLSFTRESHVIDGVEDPRVSFEAMKDWLKAFAEGC